MSDRIVEFEEHGILVRQRGSAERLIRWGEILTAERVGGLRGRIRLHLRDDGPLVVTCGGELLAVEDRLRAWGVRTVDVWGCILAPSLLDFEAELMKKPAGVRQSSDDG